MARVAWELLAAPNSGLLNQLFRLLTGADSDEHLFNIYSMTGIIFVISCYTFPFVFVLVANALDTMPGELEDASAILGGKAWTTARRITIPLALPALVAGALIAFLQAMTLFGLACDPGAAGRLPHHDHQDLEPVPVSAETGTGGSRCGAAAAVDHPVAAGTEIHPRPPRLFGGRRQIWRAAQGRDG